MSDVTSQLELANQTELQATLRAFATDCNDAARRITTSELQFEGYPLSQTEEAATLDQYRGDYTNPTAAEMEQLERRDALYGVMRVFREVASSADISLDRGQTDKLLAALQQITPHRHSDEIVEKADQMRTLLEIQSL